MDNVLDRQPSQIASVTSKSNAMFKTVYAIPKHCRYMENSKSSDRDFSFYSHVHKSYSRIDFFLLDSNLVPNACKSQYHNIIISDHAPQSVDLRLDHLRGEFRWKLNNALLKDEEFNKNLEKKIEQFIEINDKGDVHDSNLWEALKVCS